MSETTDQGIKTTADVVSPGVDQDNDLDDGWKPVIVWKYVAILVVMHTTALLAILSVPLRESAYTYLWGFFLLLAGSYGVTAGAHRLWAHRSYKAKLPLRIILAICYSVAGQTPLPLWTRDHRVHHKYTDTNADPHNIKRGFLFSHFGWIVTRRHPEVIRKSRQIDMSDVLADPVVAFHTKYFSFLKLMFCFVLPVVIPCCLWGETWYNSIMINMLRYAAVTNSTFSVNSFAHLFGTKPFDKNMYASNNVAVAFFSFGEGWHNYHHVFPWDYRTGEMGSYAFNTTSLVLDLFAKIGWAYDLKTPSKELVRKVAERSGDGSHFKSGGHMKEVSEEEDLQWSVSDPRKIRTEKLENN